MLRWSVMAAMVAASVWTVACGLDTKSARQGSTVYMDAGSGTIYLDAPATTGSDAATIYLDAPVFLDAGIYMDAGSGSAGSGSGIYMDAGTGSGSGSSSTPPDAAALDDAGAGLDARRGNPDTFDRTNFYTCASCGTGSDARLALVLVAGVAVVLRRRRR